MFSEEAICDEVHVKLIDITIFFSFYFSFSVTGYSGLFEDTSDLKHICLKGHVQVLKFYKDDSISVIVFKASAPPA